MVKHKSGASRRSVLGRSEIGGSTSAPVPSDRCCFDELPRGLLACSRPDEAGLSKHLAVSACRCCFASPSSTATHGATCLEVHQLANRRVDATLWPRR